jgi:hypothetical protein
LNCNVDERETIYVENESKVKKEEEEEKKGKVLYS